LGGGPDGVAYPLLATRTCEGSVRRRVEGIRARGSWRAAIDTAELGSIVEVVCLVACERGESKGGAALGRRGCRGGFLRELSPGAKSRRLLQENKLKVLDHSLPCETWSPRVTGLELRDAETLSGWRLQSFLPSCFEQFGIWSKRTAR
jgi:hypothetical protein